MVGSGKNPLLDTRFSPRAPLVAVGEMLRAKHFFDPIHQHVTIAQKEVRHASNDKLLDVLITILAGAHGLVEANTRLRSDPVLQRAFGRSACAEQSTIQRTLDACTPDNVKQMHLAFECLLHQHGRAYRHKFASELLVIDIDLTGVVCGRKRELATKGYLPIRKDGERGHARGRQIARATAAQYNEIIVDRVYEGRVVLETVIREVVLALEQALALSPEKRARTLIRVDSGGGGMPELDWLLERGYHILAKAKLSSGAAALGRAVEHWYTDPRHAGREVGWVPTESSAEDPRPIRLLAVRGKDKKGVWRHTIDVTTLLPHQAKTIAGELPKGLSPTRADALAVAYAYDKRGGAIEIENKQDKSGLGIGRRQKKRANAQHVLTTLNAIAHNALVWCRGWMARIEPKLRRIGFLRLVRDLLTVSGAVEFDPAGHITSIVLNAVAPLASELAAALDTLLARSGIHVCVGER
jgi:hypothetical protein